jgi:hypothetical protein
LTSRRQRVAQAKDRSTTHRRRDQATHRAPIECPIETHATHSRRGEFGQLHARSDQHVDRLGRNRLHHGVDRLRVRQARGVEHARAHLGEGSQAPDRIVEIRATVQEIVGVGAAGSVWSTNAAPPASRANSRVARQHWVMPRRMWRNTFLEQRLANGNGAAPGKLAQVLIFVE